MAAKSNVQCFYLYPELMTDLIAFHNMYLYLMVAFSTGYFMYDFVDIAVNSQISKLWEVIPHHFAWSGEQVLISSAYSGRLLIHFRQSKVGGIFFWNVVQCRCIAYNVIALLAEVNSIFLHARKLLQMSGFEFTGWLYRANATANLVSFVACRFGGLAWIVYGMTVWYERVSPIYLYLLGAAIFVLWVTNAILFWRLICSDLLRRPRQARPSISPPVASSVHCNGTIAVNGSLSDHIINDFIARGRRQTTSAMNGPLSDVHRRAMDTANGSL